jgi:hypothetical protein
MTDGKVRKYRAAKKSLDRTEYFEKEIAIHTE